MDVLRRARRRLVVDAVGLSVSVFAFGVVYGLAAREVDFSLLDAMAMSVFVFAGAAQFAAVGLIAQGAPWLGIVVLTALLNARHLLYSAALAPLMVRRSRVERALSAHFLTDESFALGLAHARRVGGWDSVGYWVGVAFTFVPWLVATAVGFMGGQVIPDPRRLGLDVVFASAMAGLAVGLIAGRREVAAAAAGVGLAVGVGAAAGPSVGVVVGGVLGPLVALLLVRESVEPGPA